MGPKGSRGFGPFHFKPKAHAEEKKRPKMNEGNPNYQNVLSKTTLSSTGQNHKRRRHHVARSNPLEDPKGDPKSYVSAIGVW